MSLVLNCDCPYCGKPFRKSLLEDQALSCPLCGKGKWKIPETAGLLTRCFICEGEEFFKQKNFNKVLGCSIILVGLVLMPWTYGISLPVLALFDLFLVQKKVKDIAVCYQCRSEFIGVPVPENFQDFNHFKAFKYERVWADKKEKFSREKNL